MRRLNWPEWRRRGALRPICPRVTVDADLPGEQAIGFELYAAEFQDRGFVFARQCFEREAAVFFEDEILGAALRGSLDGGSKRVVDVLEEKAAAAFEKWADILRKSFDCAVDDEFVGVVAPSARL